MMDSAAAARDMVLIVDDTPDTLGFLSTALEDAGFTVLVAIDGESALETLHEITPDLILMDAVMTGIDGFETCARLKRDRTSAHIPVIFMTGLTESAHVIRGLQAGGVDYVTKPVNIDELIARIRVHLNNARMAQGTFSALDSTGRALLAADATGRVLWCTRAAEELLGHKPDLLPMLAQIETRKLLPINGQTVEVTLLSTTPQEKLFRLAATGTEAQERKLREQFGLTAREAEVLVWVARGKSNKDVSEILAISPRTVNKHLEQVFLKLGVENRASATALVMKGQ